jgi:type IV pilus assembly protein PilO
MTLRFSKKELFIVIISMCLLVAFVIGSYFLYLSPKKEKLKTSETQLKTEEQLLASLQGKQAVNTAPTIESITELQKKVPVKQQLELLILDLEKAEVVSDSLITNMSFSDEDTGTTTETPPAQEPTDTTNQSQQQSDDLTQTDANGNQKPAKTPLPTGIKKLTVTLSVKSSSYDKLIKFVETVENLNRLVVVESVTFSGGSELTSLEDEQEEFSYSLTCSAFYMPTLEDLQDSLPELRPPAPSNKTNPFSSFPDVLEEDEIE